MLVGFAETQCHSKELWSIRTVGGTFRFERQQFAEAERTSVLTRRRAVEEVAAVELHSGWSLHISIVGPVVGS